MKKIKIWLLCGILLLVACGSGDEMTEPEPEQPDAAAATRAVLEATMEALDAETAAETSDDVDAQEPGAVASYYVNACQMNDPVSAKDVISFASPKPCRVPEEAFESEQLGDTEISGKTARVQWSFKLPEEREQVMELTLGQEEEGWQIISVEVMKEIWLEDSVVEIEIEIEEQLDEDLPLQIVYLVQSGSTGEKKVKTKFTKTWSGGTGTTEQEVLNEQILTEAAPTIIVVGKSRDDTASELSGLLEDYFTSYQAGEYGNLSALAPEDPGTSYAKVSEVAEFSIISFEVEEASEIRAIKPTTEEDFQVAKTERWNGYSKVVIEPFFPQGDTKRSDASRSPGDTQIYNLRHRIRL